MSEQSQHASRYAKKVASGNMMYGHRKHPPKYPKHPTAEETRRKYGDASAKIRCRAYHVKNNDEDPNKVVVVHRSRT